MGLNLLDKNFKMILLVKLDILIGLKSEKLEGLLVFGMRTKQVWENNLVRFFPLKNSRT